MASGWIRSGPVKNIGGYSRVRVRRAGVSAIVATIATFTVSVGYAMAATATTKAVASPNLWQRIVDVLADLINWIELYVHDYGVALIIVVFLIRLVTMPLMLKSLRNTKRMQSLQPMLAELKKKYAKEPRKYQEETMALYKSEGVNPFAGCMPMIIQFAILTVLYQSIYADHQLLAAKFLGFLPMGMQDHTTVLSYLLPVLAAVTSYFSQKMSMMSVDGSQKFLVYIYPVMIFIFSLRVDGALALYWVFSNVFTMGQVYFTRVRPARSGA